MGCEPMDEKPRVVDRRVVAVPGAPANTAMDASPGGERSRLIAAWDAAERVNFYNWELQTALLHLDTFYEKTGIVEYLVPALAVLARDLVDSVVQKDTLRDSIQTCWSESEFHSTRSDQLFDKTE